MQISEVRLNGTQWKIKDAAKRNECLVGEERKLTPVSVAEHWKNGDLNKSAYFYNYVRDQITGGEGMVTIQGFDANDTETAFYLDYGRYGSKYVGPDFVVWVA